MNDSSMATIEHGIELADGKRIPRIGFGTYELAQGDETKRAVLGALEAGYRHLDCARFYGNERSVGEAIRESGLARTELFVTTKVWCDRIAAGRDEVRRSIEESLEALGLDSVDLVLVHWPVTSGAGYRAAWEELQEAKRDGLTASIGVSNFDVEHLDALASDGGETPVVDQIQLHPYFQQRTLAKACEERGIVVEAWSPFGRGLCVNDPQIARIAEAHEADAGRVILAWLSARGAVSLPRTAKPERSRSNLEGLSLALSDEELAAIDALDGRGACDPGADVSVCDRLFVGIASPRD